MKIKLKIFPDYYGYNFDMVHTKFCIDFEDDPRGVFWFKKLTTRFVKMYKQEIKLNNYYN